jgi:hypothetical protein
MTRTMWIGLALLCVAGFLVIARRMSETRSSEQLRDAELRARPEHEPGSLEDSIDWDELEKAENEIKDVDPRAKPEDGFEGDDWGPGAPPKPPLV